MDIIYRMNGNLYFILSEFMVELTKRVKQALALRNEPKESISGT